MKTELSLWEIKKLKLVKGEPEVVLEYYMAPGLSQVLRKIGPDVESDKVEIMGITKIVDVTEVL